MLVHVVMALFRYERSEFTDDNGEKFHTVAFYQTTSESMMVGEDAVEFGPVLSPLVPTPFGCYQLMMYSHEHEQAH